MIITNKLQKLINKKANNIKFFKQMKTEQALEKLTIKVSAFSTFIEFDNKTNVLVMRGHNVPADAYTFFIPLMDWTEEYLKLNPGKITLNISFEYLHTAAARQVYELIKYIKKSGNTLIVNWNYEEEDDDMKQLGMDFSSTLGIEFNFSTFIIL